MTVDKFIKSVKPITENVQSSWCGETRKLLFELNLGHVWSSEITGQRKDWIALIRECIKMRELECWTKDLQMKTNYVV